MQAQRGVAVGVAEIPCHPRRIAGFALLITGIALAILAVCFAAGRFTPPLKYPTAAFIGAGLGMGSLIALMSSAYLLCRSPKVPPFSAAL